ncbi:MAG: hypothetical protein WB819_11190, partial [Terriglobia bacterium]
ILSEAKDLFWLSSVGYSRCFAEFILSPFTSLRAVRKRRANGLSMTTTLLPRPVEEADFVVPVFMAAFSYSK